MEKQKINKEVMLRCLTKKASDLELELLLRWLENDPANLIAYNSIKEELEAQESRSLKARENLSISWNSFKIQVINNSISGNIRRLRNLRIAASVAILLGLGASLLLLVPRDKPAQEQLITAKLEMPYIISASGQKHFLNPEKQSIRFDEILQDSVSTQQNKKKARRKPEMNELIVPRGYRINLELADGTLVWLNSESRLRYPVHFTGETRQISLSGEGYFQVKHSDTNPFIVETTDVTVEVMGTSFNISAFENEDHITTTLVEGSVKLHTIGNQEDIILLPNQCGIYSLPYQNIKVQCVDTELHTSWINGYYAFNHEPLEVVIQKLIRSYGIPISINNQGLKEYKFSGKLELKNTLTEVLDVLKLVAPIEYHATDGRVIIQNLNDESL
ncbi:MAG: FecR domain-containing protein [Bacteroidota bacterium]|nr:FecR domain-containing protein [Bacteroidota bacterium]